MSKKKQHYVNNAEFLEAIKVYRKSIEEAKANGTIEPRMPDYIGKCLFLIAENVATFPKYRGYSYIDEMISDAVLNAIKYFHNFDHTKGNPPNPFAYFTQVVTYSFWKTIREEKSEKYITYKMIQSFVPENDYDLISPNIYDNINDYIETFEKTDAERKLKRKKSKEGLGKFFTKEGSNTNANTNDNKDEE